VSGETERVARERRASTAAAELTAEGTPVRFTGALHTPDDEVCFVTFDAATAGVAELAAHRAGLDPVPVVNAVVSDPDLPTQQQQPDQQENP
jgi:hypothetical protein